MKTLLLLLALLPLLFCEAVPLRVVTFNIESQRDSNGDTLPSLTAPGTIDYDSVRDILARINADVVCLQELTNLDVSGGLNGGTNSVVNTLATELGLPYVHIPTSSGVLDFTLRNAILSRYPLLDTEDVGSADYQDSISSVGAAGGRAKDVTRAIPAVSIDVPGAAAPLTVCTLHAKSATGPSDRFRRAVELAKLRDYLSNNALNSSDNILITGDFNLSSFDDTFTAEPPNGLPTTWNRGSEIALPISYSIDPDFYFPAPFNLVAVDARAVNGNDATFQSGSTIDFILSSPALTEIGSEVYRSPLDTANNLGLPKVGDPLPVSTSGDASDHYAVFADFELVSLIPPPTSYSLTDASPKVVEPFDDFAGAGEPAPWNSHTSNWLGLASSEDQPGSYAFDTSGNRSVGVVASETATTFTATFDNDTTSPIEALDFSYLARQFTAFSPGTSDTLEVALTIAGGSPIALPDLTFDALPGAALPASATLSASIDGLSIPVGGSFDLTFTATRGPDLGGPVADEVFLNEIHYDNTGTDTGEFVEIVVSPGFGGNLSDIALLLYNDNGNLYGTHELTGFDNFLTPGTSNGYQIFYKFIAGLQNGSADGLAIVIDGVATSVLSYEGTFTGAEGPAGGMTSTDIGSQPTNGPIGSASLGLTGSGLDSSELTWITFPTDSPHTPGAVNAGQVLTGSTPLPSQAFSFDNVTVCIAAPRDTDDDGNPDSADPDDDNDTLPDLLEVALGLDPLLVDSDGDGIPDIDEDSDGDGQSNGSEFLITLTDPADPSSLFSACLGPHPTNAGQLQLTFPTLAGRSYQVRSGPDPTAPNVLANYGGSGSDFAFLVLPNQPVPTFFTVKVSLVGSD